MTGTKLLTVATLTGLALMAGLFFGYGNSVMPTLEQLPDGQGAATMNMINVVIYNPIFLLILSGTGLLSLVIVVLGFTRRSPGRWWLLAGAVLYFVAGMITMTVNVPLNDQLATLDPASPEGVAEWARFAPVWGAANNLRMIACTLSVITVSIALAYGNTPDRATGQPGNAPTRGEQYGRPPYPGGQGQGLPQPDRRTAS